MTGTKLRICLAGLLLVSLLSACKNSKADLLLVNGIIHTMDAAGTVQQAIAIRDGKIVALGRSDELQFGYQADSVIDLRGMHVFPGLIDAHCHFVGYAKNQQILNLTGTTSWQEVVDLVSAMAPNLKTKWVEGRGWDQTKWEKQQFPDNTLLNKSFPDRPVYLKRVDGHAAIANEAALKLAGIDERTRVQGGVIQKRGGRLTGLLLDAAMEKVEAVIPKPTRTELAELLMKAEQNLLASGLTTVDDAGLDLDVIQFIDTLQRQGKLHIRVYAMANPNEENFAHFEKTGEYNTGSLHVKAFKIYADGALGSRGACMLRPYKDDPGNQGFIYSDPSAFLEAAERIHKMGFQMATHCIGDSTNRLMLHIYGKVLGGKNDQRWRIEHAQVIDTNDFHLFKDYSVWPSVQPTHAMSDRKWAEDRIGKDRMKGAYAYKTLFSQNGRIAFGSDFPVEDINPMLGYHASVARVDLEGKPYGGFFKNEAVGRDTALRAMTIWAAESNFEEKVKGSLEVGKFADMIILKDDLLTMKEDQIPYARVLRTIIGGKIVFSVPN